MTTLKDIINQGNGTSFYDLIVLVNSVEKRLTQTNDTYYHLILADKDISIPAKVWPDSINFVPVNNLKQGDVIKISGTVNIYNGNTQLIIDKGVILHEGEYDESILFPLSSLQIKKLYQELLILIESVKNQKLRNTLQLIFTDKTIKDKFISAPGGEIIHHAYKGGLLEHTLEVADIALSIYKHYQDLCNKDIIIAGALLHDIGKIFEYNIKTKERTLSGYLIGHIVLGMQLFNKFWNNAEGDNDDNIRMQVIHIILSHHTELEYGAVVRPATIEASIVAQADMASSTVKQFAQEHIKINPDVNIGAYNKFIKTKVIKLPKVSEK